jgi:putative ABC transport system permease protein
VNDGTEIDVVLELLDAGSAIWRPSLAAGALGRGSGGVVITTKAADDLRVGVGDTIVLRHPRRVALRQLQLVATPVTVAGIDPNPIRVYAYMDQSRAGLLGLEGATNVLNVAPVPGADLDTVKRSLLDNEGVASAERVAAASEALSDALSAYTDILRVVEAVALALALLIAFNSASIAADERAREYATMFAYGVPLRTVLRNAMAEGGAAGILATLVGVGAGLLVIRYIVRVTTPRVLPDLGAAVSVSAETILLAAVLGIAATAIAPLLTARKLSRMDVPSTLRVVE